MKRFVAVFLCFCLLFCACSAAPKEWSDGLYSCKVELSGGSGRAEILSPCEIECKDGQFFAMIQWSSPFYEYMLVNEQRYEPLSIEDGAVFCIPVVLDEEMAVSASTVAMSQPYLIDYTLRFDSSTLKEKAE